MAKTKPKPLCPGCVNYANGADYVNGGCYIRMLTLLAAGAEPEACTRFAPAPVTAPAPLPTSSTPDSTSSTQE